MVSKQTKETTMRALVVRQPFASLISAGKKRIEWRSWKTNYRGDLVIVAAKRRPRAVDVPRGVVPDLPLGMAVCVVYLAACTWNQERRLWEWHLDRIRPLARPFAVHGRLGLFAVQVPV
jgi:ASCH domain